MEDDIIPVPNDVIERTAKEKQIEERRKIIEEKMPNIRKFISANEWLEKMKTTFLKWLCEAVKDKKFIYIGKSPETPEQLVDIFNDEFKPPWYLRLFRQKIKNIYQVPEVINKSKKYVVLLFDEIHETNSSMLEWIRVLGDQTENMSVVLAGLPVFNRKLEELETLRKRIVGKIELLSLTKEETRELIRKRIQFVNGRGDEFDNIIDELYERTAGFPREIIRMAYNIVDSAIEKNEVLIQPKIIKDGVKKELPSRDLLEDLTPMQRKIMELLKNPMTPGQIADSLNLEKYKSRQHAVRSVNNILKGLMKENFVERRREDKAFVYYLAPRVKTLLVKY